MSLQIEADQSEIVKHRSFHSVLRERIVEHMFVSDLLRRFWFFKIFEVEILRAEFDAGGYDLAISLRGIVRYVQLKARSHGGKRRNFSIAKRLLQRVGSCVIVIDVDEALNVIDYYWLGRCPEQNLDHVPFKTAKHSKGNSEGKKLVRPQQATVSISQFEHVSDFDFLIEKLLGAPPQTFLTASE